MASVTSSRNERTQQKRSCLLDRIRSHAELGLETAVFAAQLRDLMYQGVKMSAFDFNESAVSVYFF